MTEEPDILSDTPPFKLAGAVWYCWITDRGGPEGAERHEWRTVPRGGHVGRNPGGRVDDKGNVRVSYWATVNGRKLGNYPSIREAMTAVAMLTARHPAAAYYHQHGKRRAA